MALLYNWSAKHLTNMFSTGRRSPLVIVCCVKPGAANVILGRLVEKPVPEFIIMTLNDFSKKHYRSNSC